MTSCISSNIYFVIDTACCACSYPTFTSKLIITSRTPHVRGYPQAISTKDDSVRPNPPIRGDQIIHTRFIIEVRTRQEYHTTTTPNTTVPLAQLVSEIHLQQCLVCRFGASTFLWCRLVYTEICFFRFCPGQSSHK